MVGSFLPPLAEQSPEMAERADVGTPAHLQCSGSACGLMLALAVLAKVLELVWLRVCPQMSTFACMENTKYCSKDQEKATNNPCGPG